jgi:hypothetical protein
VIDTRYWQYLTDGTLFAPDGLGKLAFRELRTNKFGRDSATPTKAEYVYRQVREYRDRFPDKAVIAGQGGFGPLPVLMAGGAEAVSAEGGALRDGGRHDDEALGRFVEGQLAGELPRMSPVDGLVDGAWCLAEAGKAWLVYSPKGEAIHFAQPVAAAGRAATWFNPRTGATQPAPLDGTAALAKPTAEAWLLWIKP